MRPNIPCGFGLASLKLTLARIQSFLFGNISRERSHLLLRGRLDFDLIKNKVELSIYQYIEI